MSDGEIHALLSLMDARLLAMDERVRGGFIDTRNDLMGLTTQVKATNGRVRDHDIVQAEQRGALRALTYVATAAIAIPSAIGAVVGVVLALRAMGG